MKLTGAGSSTLELEVLGYQFPDEANDPFDSNWLIIAGSVTHPRGPWAFCDACLLTYELGRLADWLDSVRLGASAGTKEEFLEPNLAFELVELEGRRLVRVFFELECRPGWAPKRGAGARDVWLDFDASAPSLERAASSLRAALARHPERATG